MKHALNVCAEERTLTFWDRVKVASELAHDDELEGQVLGAVADALAGTVISADYVMFGIGAPLRCAASPPSTSRQIDPRGSHTKRNLPSPQTDP